MVESVYLKKADADIKRAEHTLFVSLKYSRTADVLKSFIDRAIECIDTIVSCLLTFEKDKGFIESFPSNVGLQYDFVKAEFNTPIINEMIDFVFYMKKLSRAQYTSTQEFRRHIALTFEVDGEEIVMKSDDAREHLKKLKEFLNHADELIEEKENQHNKPK